MRLAPAALALLLACGGASEPPPLSSPSAPAAAPEDETTRPAAPGAEALEAAEAALAEHPLHRVPLGDSPVLGPPEAPITVVAFSDFECPYCARAVASLEALRARYGERLRIVFRHMPLPYHRRAMAAHEAAVEAREQGGDEAFWAMHDRIFAFRDIAPERLEGHARTIGLDVDRFRAALGDGRHRDRIAVDRRLGNELGVRGTPTFFINGRRLTGAKPPEAFAALIEPLLVEAQARLAAGTPPAALYDALTADGATLAAPQQRRGPTRVSPPPVPPHAPRRGAAEPDLVVQVFSDFECPYCRRLVPLLRRLEADFPEVQIVWRHFPLSQHPRGRLASEVGAAIRAQAGDRAFWRFHDALYEEGGPLVRERLLDVAASLEGVERQRIAAAVDGHAHTLEIAQDLAKGREVGVRSTPTILVGGLVVRGARSYLELEELVDEELAAAE